jgi:SAM-dependent methyltransferase
MNPTTSTTATASFVNSAFPKSSQYHPDWVRESAGGGACALWLAEWLTRSLMLKPGMRVLDLGCGRAATSIFLAREFGVQVYACDLWVPATYNAQRIHDAGLDGQVIPLHVDARSLPFAAAFFDAIVMFDSFYYFGTDFLYLNYLASFLKLGGQLGAASAGLMHDLDGVVPYELRAWWTQDLWGMRTAEWIRKLWEPTGLVTNVRTAHMPEGWRHWLAWHEFLVPDNHVEIAAIRADAGRTMGYVSVTAERTSVPCEPYCWPDPLKSMPTPDYQRRPLLASTP